MEHAATQTLRSGLAQLTPHLKALRAIWIVLKHLARRKSAIAELRGLKNARSPISVLTARRLKQ